MGGEAAERAHGAVNGAFEVRGAVEDVGGDDSKEEEDDEQAKRENKETQKQKKQEQSKKVGLKMGLTFDFNNCQWI